MFDVVIIGGGIVGLASALKIKEALPNKKVLVIEKEKKLATHQTGHNSGVIHSGLYYKPGSLKAINCVQGYRKLVEFATVNDIPFEICGKIVVATTPEELARMNTLYERGVANGLSGIKRLSSPEELREYEPHVSGIEGLFVPQTGIIDYSQVATRMSEIFLAKGGELHLGEKVEKIERIGNDTTEIECASRSLRTKVLVNCAGLYSDKVARLTGSKSEVKIIPFRGEYFKLRPEKESLVKNLVYPVPDPSFPFLGVHFTRMIHGGVEAGPNAVLAFRREGYRKTDLNLNELIESLLWPGFQKVAIKYWRTGLGEMYRSYSKSAFTRALQRLLPEIEEKDLIYGGAGVRAQAFDKSGGLIDDFLIEETRTTVNVFNAPSPAATSSLAIGGTIASLIQKKI